MKNKIWSACVRLLSLLLALSLCCPTLAAGDSEVDAAVSDTAQYLQALVTTPQVGSIGGEWAVLGLARSGCDISQDYFDGYYQNVVTYVQARGGVLATKKYTEYSRVILALTAIGRDPTNVGGYNLLTPLGDYEKTIWQGINGPIWALIALDSGNYDIPVNSAATVQATRELYVDEILSHQLKNGGFSLIGIGGSTAAAEPDITAMALQALSNDQERSDVAEAIEKAVTCLSDMQDENGGYENTEQTAQAIVALTALGISLDDSRFVKNGNSLIENLLACYVKGSGFTHTVGESTNQMSTEQAFYALVAVQRVQAGKTNLFRMSDVTVTDAEDELESAIGLPNKNADVKACTITKPGVTFDDIRGHRNQTAIEQLASRGIIDGMGDGTFSPDTTMTRAQFAAIVVRGLGLTPQANGVFSDVATDAWYAGYVGTAYTYGIVYGTSASTFSPDSTITRQEAAVMVARGAKLCGMDTELTATEIKNMLAQFGDWVEVSSWAQNSVAFCYQEDILAQSDLNILPSTPILRCEIAQMLCNMLDSANLL